MALLKNFQTSLSIAASETDTTSTLLFAIPSSPILKPYLIIHNYTVIIFSGKNMLKGRKIFRLGYFMVLGCSIFHLV